MVIYIILYCGYLSAKSVLLLLGVFFKLFHCSGDNIHYISDLPAVIEAVNFFERIFSSAVLICS